jgi:hypothetical protein
MRMKNNITENISYSVHVKKEYHIPVVSLLNLLNTVDNASVPHNILIQPFHYLRNITCLLVIKANILNISFITNTLQRVICYGNLNSEYTGDLVSILKH